MKRVIIFRNGSQVDGKVILVTHSIEDLLYHASIKLGINAKKLFTPKGGEIDEINLIRDDDILYVSCGEPFQPINSNDTQKLCTLSSVQPSCHDWILLNVGGKIFSTTKSTLTKEPDSMLARMFSNDNGLIHPSPRDSSGAYLIDRSPEYFEPILGYLRHGELIIPKNLSAQGVLEEAKFYGLSKLIPIVESIVSSEEVDINSLALTRRDIINALIVTSINSQLRFQGINLAGADLSRLDLKNINFRYANLRGANLQGANLSYCCLERCDLSSSNMENAILFGVKMVCANLEGANLRGAYMDDPHRKATIMESANLKGANLEGSQMAGVNLRVCTLKNANLRNCNLRGANLAGADLENCDLSGSDLFEANLTGTNLKNTAFDSMLTPLHMAQIIR